ncbi:MAG TPA: nuclear transport factor 2 family protein [Candidatus Dormibacteraeota bacterium]
MSDRKKVEEMLDRYRTAVYDKDLDAFIGLYDENARVYDLWGRWMYSSASEWRKPAEEWFASLGTDRSSPEFHDVQIDAGDNIAAVHAFITYRGQSAEGTELRSMDNRITWVLRKNSDGAWKIVHEHTSAPADFDTGKVTLKRGSA